MASYNGYAKSRGSPRPEPLEPIADAAAPKAGVRPDGFPVLPPIRKPDNPRVDPYANSKLLTFRLAKTQKNLLMKIL